MDETGIEDARAEDAKIEELKLWDASANDLEEIDTIIAELEVSKGRGNLILCVVNAPACRDRIIRVLRKRFSSKIIPVEEGEDIIQRLKSEEFGGAEVLIWTMPEKLTEDLADALNNFRELFYDVGVPSLVFLSQSFLDDAIRNAPDFWRYRGNYYELKGRDQGPVFEAIDVLATSLHYQSKEDLLRRKRINEYLLEKVKDEKEIVNILDELGEISFNLGDYDKTSNYLDQMLKLSKEIDYEIGAARSLHQMGRLAHVTGDLKKARCLYADSLKIFLDLGEKREASLSLNNLGILAQDAGDLKEARRFYCDSLNIAQDLGDKSCMLRSLGQLGILAHITGDIKEAGRRYEECLEIAQDLGDKSSTSRLLHQLGMLAHYTGRLNEARFFYVDSLEIKQELGDKRGMAITLGQFSLLEKSEGNLERALNLIRQAETLFQELGSPMTEKAREIRERLEKNIANEQS